MLAFLIRQKDEREEISESRNDYDTRPPPLPPLSRGLKRTSGLGATSAVTAVRLGGAFSADYLHLSFLPPIFPLLLV